MTLQTKSHDERSSTSTSDRSRTVIRLAAAADVDPRSAQKALRHGLESVRPRTAARLAAVAPALGISFPDAAA